MLSMKKSASRIVGQLCLLLTCMLMCQGCGTGNYEQKMEASRARLETQKSLMQRFDNDLYAEAPIPDTSIGLRVPLVFENPPQSDVSREPAFVRSLPGLKLDYQVYGVDANNVEHMFHLYVGVTESSPDLLQTLSGKVKRAFSGSKADWQDETCDTPTGGTVAWKRLRVTGPQPFQSRAGTVPTEPGIFDLWVHDAAGTSVLVAWRVPTSIAKQTKYEELAPLTAGTVAEGG